ncbi:PH domain-containing protein [Anaerosacchariphilus polymeriproducens]|uniref:PH domain-containing protein n=1 Tax=Anaerosacchariphilus polymeriproducens TaxID=1812858 RepID=A0A371AXM7_9FIRM|nr:PH domain-containing protein [Anaerosacchariphilus polymeriproducens]RDU24328.1 PH domain-containing protein [Anaerosacchariphilus polymeriproducens]
MGYKERKRILFFGLPWTFTRYTIEEDILTINTGLIKQVENDCFMYKIQDVQMTSGFFERMFGMGTIICYTGDKTHPQLILQHIKNSREIKEFILKTSEEARMKRRTINTLDIGIEDGDLE